MSIQKIYLASSWRNEFQPRVLAQLREEGFEVYDFRNPEPGNDGFSWKQIDPDLHDKLTADRLRKVLAHPIACAGFKLDFDAMKWADACVLLLPCGMSAHLEAGWFAGAGKPLVVFGAQMREPELMYKMGDTEAGTTPIYGSIGEVISYLRGVIL